MIYLSALATLSAGLALVLAYGLFGWINKVDEGTEKAREIAGYIKVVSMAFLKREYKTIIFVIVVLAAGIGLFFGWVSGVSYAAGAALSAVSVFVGMRAATKGSVRTVSAAASGGASDALKVAFRSGSITGLYITGLPLFGISLAVMLLDPALVREAALCFALGASTVSLFNRIGGGVFAKAVSMSTDPTGERSIIGDGAGGNAIGTAGTGSDLFESYTFAMAAAIILAPHESVYFPLLICGVGLLASIAGIIFVRGGEDASPAAALGTSRYASGFIVLLCALFISKLLLGDFKWGAAAACGLIAGIAVSKVTETHISDLYRSVKKIVGWYQSGVAPGIISGFSTGIRSAVLPILFMASAILAANAFAGRYGIALCAVGMLSTTCLAAAAEAFAPVSGSAAGIAEMSDSEKEVRQITDNLSAAANTASTAGKGYITGAAVFAAIAIFVVYLEFTRLRGIDLLNPMVMLGLVFGAALPLLFASLVINSVGKGGMQILVEIDGAEPDIVKCAEVSAKSAFKSVVLPGLLSIAAPVIAGILLGTEALGGVLAGAVLTGTIVASIMANSGSALDSAKRYIEYGNPGGKRSKSYKAASAGKAAGEPLKDAVGPALNIFIKIIMVISVILAGEFVKIGGLI